MNNTKEKKIEIRLTETEKEYVKTAAALSGMTMSEYARYMILCEKRLIVLEEGKSLAQSFISVHKDLQHFYKYKYLPEEKADQILAVLEKALIQLNHVTDRLSDIHFLIDSGD